MIDPRKSLLTFPYNSNKPSQTHLQAVLQPQPFSAPLDYANQYFSVPKSMATVLIGIHL